MCYTSLESGTEIKKKKSLAEEWKLCSTPSYTSGKLLHRVSCCVVLLEMSGRMQQFSVSPSEIRFQAQLGGPTGAEALV